MATSLESTTFHTWRESVELRLRRLEELEKAVVALRSEHIDEVRRRKALEAYIAKKEEEQNTVGPLVFDKPKKGSLGKDRAGDAPGVGGKSGRLSVRQRTISASSSTLVVVNREKGKKGFTQSNPVQLEVKGSSMGFPIFSRVAAPLDSLDEEQLLEWLENYKFHAFIPMFTGEPPKPSIDQGDDLPYYDMFVRVENQNAVSLHKCNIAKLLEFIFLPEDAPLRSLWDTTNFVRCLILTSQAFMKLEQLFKFLTLKCGSTGSSTTTILLTKDFIKQFVHYCKYDLIVDSKIPKMIVDLAASISRVNAEVAQDIAKSLEQAMKPAKMTSNPPPSTTGGLKNFELSNDILTLDAVEIARQLTLLEQKYFHGTELREFMNKGWTDDTVETPNLDAYIEFTNRVSGWMTREILVQPMPKLQAEVITLFIQVGVHLLELSNFNGINQVLACLLSPAIEKLKTAWTLPSKKVKEDLARLAALMHLDGHYHDYEETIRSVNEEETPAIPFLTPPLQNLFLMDEALSNVAVEPKGWINWDKMIKLAKVLWAYRKFQKKFNFLEVLEIKNYIERTADVWEGKAAYEIAKMREEHAQVVWNILPPKPVRCKQHEVIDWFNYEHLTIALWQLVLGGTEKLQILKPDQDVIKRGDDIKKIFYVEAGELTIESLSRKGIRVRLGKVGKNQLIGLETLLQLTGPIKSAVWFTARGENARIREVDTEHLFNLFKTEDELFSKFNRMLAGQMASLIQNRKPSGTPEAIAPNLDIISSNPTANIGKNQKRKSFRSFPFKVKKPVFEEIFNLEGEISIKEVPCSWKKTPTVAMSGILFVTQNYLCFGNYNLSMVKVKHKLMIDMRSIQSIQKHGKTIVITTTKHNGKEKQVIELVEFGEKIKEVNDFLNGFWHRKIVKVTEGSIQSLPDSKPDDFSSADSCMLTSNDWDRINAGSKMMSFHEGEVIIQAGSIPKSGIFIVVSGGAVVHNKQGKLVTSMKKGDIFGSVSFFLHSIEKYAILAAEEDTKIRLIERYFLDVLNSYFPKLCGKFFYYLANDLANKLQAMYNQGQMQQAALANSAPPTGSIRM